MTTKMNDEDEKPRSLTTERCRECFYVGYFDSHSCNGPICCDYILVTGKMRGCPAGDDCIHFLEGHRPKHLLRDRYRNFSVPS